MKKRPASPMTNAPDFRLRKENVLLRSRVEKLSREMQVIRELHASVGELDSLRNQVRDLRDRLGIREIEVVGLHAELGRLKGEQDFMGGEQGTSTGLTTTKTNNGDDTTAEAQGGIWARRRSDDSYYGCDDPELRQETPTSIDERVRALRQHLGELGPMAHIRRPLPLWKRLAWMLA